MGKRDKRKCYVSMKDASTCAWGVCGGKATMLVFVCDDYKEAEAVFENARAHSGMKNVMIDIEKPYYHTEGYYTRFRTKGNSSKWDDKNFFLWHGC